MVRRLLPGGDVTAAQISQEEIDALAKKLENLELSDYQRELLEAIIAVAAKAVAERMPDTIPPLSQQFTTAFTPGRAELLVNLTHITKGP